MSGKKIPRSLATHDGSFHADEVTACALLLQVGLIEVDKIYRTRDPALLETCEFVSDVGGVYDPERKLFDHHQMNYPGELSSAGMVLKYLKDIQILSEDLYLLLNRIIISGVDAHDNGKDLKLTGVTTYSNIISNFNPIRNDCSPQEQDAAFFEALQFASGHFSRLFQRYEYSLSCKGIVENEMKKNESCLMFDVQIPWLDAFFELGGESHPAQFIIMPAGSHWKLRGIPPNVNDKMNVRIPLPKEWAGLLDMDLKKLTGIPGAIFCHKGRFISVWETKEDALKALNDVLNKE